MPRRILLPVDLSEKDTARKALSEALALVGSDGVLHVVSVLPDFGLPQVSGFFRKGFEKEALTAFGKALSDWVEEMVPDAVEVRPHVLHGTIYDEILRASDKLGIDVIVMASHRPAFRDYLLGPNAARVVRHARCSVYVVRD
jgi:nucleotide-binding universal stress UspA family protein